MSKRKDWNDLDDERQPHKKKGGFARFFLALFSLVLVVAIIAAAIVGFQAYAFLNTPPQSPGRDIIVDVLPGSTLRQTANQLEEQGLITDATYFTLLARIDGKEQKLQAGRFLVNTGWLPREVLEQLVSGKAMLYRVTVPEGKTWWETGKILEDAGMLTFADFETVITDPDFLNHWGIPFANAEGFLYPDTYLMPQPRELNVESARSVLNRLLNNFWSKADSQLWPDGRPGREQLKETIILASIVEKETGVGGERAMVAGVYANRLKINMLLQADPTVIYGVGPSFSGSLLRSQLDDASNPYNTYKNAGLPPGPICSPGAAAINAALHPEEHNYYYFVATGTDNTHVFSTNLDDHNRAVARYRNALRQSGN